MELLKEIAPRTERVALLFNPVTAVPVQFFMPSIQAAVSSSAVQASAAPVHAKDEIKGVIAAQARNPGGGLIVMPDAFNTHNRNLIIGLAAHYGVPASYAQDIFAQSGGLIAYSSVRTDAYRQVEGTSTAFSGARSLPISRCKRLHEVRAVNQYEDRENTRPRSSSKAARACRRGD